MITSREILSLTLALIVLAFTNSFEKIVLNKNFNLAFINSLLFFAIILIIYTFAKKFVAYYYEAEEETKIWTFQRYGLHEKNYFKNPVPIGIILPFILSILSLGYIKWFAVTESEIKPLSIRAVKRHGIYSFSEMTEGHLALISAAGIFSMFLLSILAYIINLPALAKLSIFFATFNLLPLGKLDGTKIFLGSRPLYFLIVLLDIIALSYAFFLP